MELTTPETIAAALMLMGLTDKSKDDPLNEVNLQLPLGEWTLQVWGRSPAKMFVDLSDGSENSIRLAMTDDVSKLVAVVHCVEEFVAKLKDAVT